MAHNKLSVSIKSKQSFSMQSFSGGTTAAPTAAGQHSFSKDLQKLSTDLKAFNTQGTKAGCPCKGTSDIPTTGAPGTNPAAGADQQKNLMNVLQSLVKFLQSALKFMGGGQQQQPTGTPDKGAPPAPTASPVQNAA